MLPLFFFLRSFLSPLHSRSICSSATCLYDMTPTAAMSKMAANPKQALSMLGLPDTVSETASSSMVERNKACYSCVIVSFWVTYAVRLESSAWMSKGTDAGKTVGSSKVVWLPVSSMIWVYFSTSAGWFSKRSSSDTKGVRTSDELYWIIEVSGNDDSKETCSLIGVVSSYLQLHLWAKHWWRTGIGTNFFRVKQSLWHSKSQSLARL